MSHFAKVENGIVTDVIVAEQEFIDAGHAGDPSLWIQTSVNTRNGVHLGPDAQPDGGVPLRGNYAGIGYAYDAENDVFIPGVKPFPSWTLCKTSWTWKPPKSYPNIDTNNPKNYHWNEETLDWDEVPFPEGFVPPEA